MKNSQVQRVWCLILVVTLGLAVGAFGANYSWAHAPLIVASAVLGLAGLALGRTRPPVVFCVSFLAIAAAALMQLIPLSESQLATWSPHALEVVRSRIFLPDPSAPIRHPLSIEPSQTWLGLAFFASFGVLLLGTSRLLTRDGARLVAGGVAILGAMLAAIGIIQKATFSGRIYGFWELEQGGSPFGPFVNKNHFAGWMLMALPAALGYLLALISRGMQGRQPGFRNLVLWFSGEQASRSILAAFAILVMGLSVVLTMSRSGMMAGAVAVLIAGGVAVRRQSGSSRRTLAAAYLVFLALAVVSWVGLDQIAARFGEVDVTSINERPAIWADTIRIIKDFWLTGTGLNTYGVSTLFYQTSAPGLHLREAHSDYLQLAAEGGLLLGIPILLTIVAFALEVRRRFRQDVGSIWWIRAGAVIGLLAIAIQSIGEFSLQMPANAAFFAVIAGLAIHDGRRM